MMRHQIAVFMSPSHGWASCGNPIPVSSGIEQSAGIGPENPQPDITGHRLGDAERCKDEEAEHQRFARRQRAEQRDAPACADRQDRRARRPEQGRDDAGAECRVVEQSYIIAEAVNFGLPSPLMSQKLRTIVSISGIDHRKGKQDQHRQEQEIGGRRVGKPPAQGGEPMLTPRNPGGLALLGAARCERDVESSIKRLCLCFDRRGHRVDRSRRSGLCRNFCNWTRYSSTRSPGSRSPSTNCTLVLADGIDRGLYHGAVKRWRRPCCSARRGRAGQRCWPHRPS